MDLNQSIHLLDLPNEVLEKIVDHLPFVVDLQNLRLTCKRLNNLCNCEHVCRQEVIVWSKQSANHITSSYCKSTRGCFNLKLVDVTLDPQQISAFFEQHGAKVRSLSFLNCQSPPGLFELIIMHCVALRSLSITLVGTCTFSFEPNKVTRPTVTFLELILDATLMHQSPDIFPRILSVFPRVKHLNVISDRIYTDRYGVPDSVILDFVANFNHLESLKLDILLNEPLNQEQKFLDSLPKLKQLCLSFNLSFQEPSNFWKTFASRLNTSSIELDNLDIVHSNDIISLLSITNLKNLSYSVFSMYLNIEVFKALVSSKLKTIKFEALDVFTTDLSANLQIEANKTVTDMNLQPVPNDYNEQSFIMVLFPTYFHGLIHLRMGIVSDEILHAIFKYQKNLRSLVLRECQDCSVAGFCGTVDTQFENSITNLQKLEHLSLTRVDPAVIQSESFQTALNFPQLKYLRITVNVYEVFIFRNIEIQINMFKSCVNLEALRLQEFAVPSSEILSSLHQNLKHLNYLCVSDFECGYSVHTYVNLKHFYWVDLRQLRLDRYPELYYYDKILDRTVFSETPVTCSPLYSPKISSHTVDWITLG